MALVARRLSLPRLGNGPLAGARGLDRHEDWSEIEDLLASPSPACVARRMHARRRSPSLVVSTAAASAVFAGLLVAALGGLTGRCSQPDRCGTPAAPTASASDAFAVVPEKVAAKPMPAATAERVSDAGPPQPDAAALPVVQGRSVSESEARPEDAAPVAAAPAGAAPRHHGRARHQRRFAK